MGLFTGKTVIITGGGKATLKDGSAGSIGYGIDIAFAKEGANLVITGRNVAKLEAAKESLEAEYGVKVLPVQADVSAGQDNEAVVQNVIDKAIEEFGRIDAVVNNAQASASGVTIADHTMDQFNLAIYSGLYATYLYMQKAYPHLKETKAPWSTLPRAPACLATMASAAMLRQGGHPRPDPRCRQRVGQGRHQRQYRLPACLDCCARELPGCLSRGVQGQRPHAAGGSLRRRREGNRPRGRSTLRSRL